MQQAAASAARDMVPRLNVCDVAWHPLLPGGGPVRQRWLDGDGSLVATGGTDSGQWWMRWPALGTYVFGSVGPVTVHPAPGARLSALQDTYQRGVVPVVMLSRDREALHASAVLDSRGLTAFCAVSGTGKSCLARAVADAGLPLWADDTTVLEFDDAGVRSVAMPCASRVDAAAASAIGSSPGPAVVATGTKATLGRIYFASRDAHLDPALPRVTAIEGGARFERLLAHAHTFELSNDARRRRTIERLLLVAGSTPTFELRFAPSLAHLPRLADAVRAHMRSI